MMKVKTSLLTLILCSTAMLPTAVLSSPAAVAAACTALNFKAARTYAAGTNPRSVAHADFDADGDLDLAVANYGSHNVSVLDGDGAGNFAPPSNVQAGTNPREVTVADFNGDGRPDLITANERSSSLSVILNAGGGAFGAAQTVGVGAFPHSVAVADYNSDGKLDLVVGYGGSSFISMLLGDGAGNFAPPTQHSLTSHIGAHQLGAADFNADGKTDVFVVLASGGADNLAVLLGDGAGGLGEPKISLGGSNAVHGIAGDFNADGKVDVVTADSRPTSTGPVALMLGDGAGRFAFPLQFTAGGNPMAVAAGDFDGDSKTDLVAANEISNGVSFLAGTGGAGADAFAPAKHFGVGTDPTALTVADFNRDGRPDIVSANHASNDVSVVLNRGGGDFAATLNLPVRLNPWGMASADFNGDGRADLATANSSDNSISLLFAQGAGGFAPSVRVAAPGPRWLAAADFNGDGKADLAIANQNVAQVFIMLGDGTGSFGTPVGFASLLIPGPLVVFDFDNDGKLDIGAALFGRFTIDSGGIVVMLGDGAGNFHTPRGQAAGTNPSDIALGRFNGDGVTDFAVANQHGGSITIFTPDNAGTFPIPSQTFGVGGGFGPLVESVAVGDFNGDGKDDVAAGVTFSTTAAAPVVAVALGDGAGGLGAMTHHVVGSTNPSLATGDFNGDGHLDIVSANRGFDRSNVSVLLGDGAGSFAPAQNFAGGSLPVFALPGDFDNDGRLDLAVTNSAGHDVSLIYNPCPGAAAAPAVEFGAAHYAVGEGAGSLRVNVLRSGDASVAFTVRYASGGGTASERSDYTSAQGILSFAAGEARKSFSVVVTDDAFDEADETLNLTLSSPTGGVTLGPVSGADITIGDNDTGPSAANPADGSDFFVRQHYADFLNREPDAAGLVFWSSQIEGCGADAQCREVRRVNVSAAFFLSIEFQETGYYAYRVHKAAFGDLPNQPVPIRFGDFLSDSRQIGDGVQVGVGNWQQQLDANKSAFTLAFVNRPEFAARYPSAMEPGAFVDALNVNTGGALSEAERDALVAELAANNTAAGRATILRKVAEDQTLAEAQKNKAFVLMQYFGYLRRNPDDPDFQGNPDPNFLGYHFWLQKLNDFNGNFVNAEMVRAFISSIEYRRRFGQ